MFVEKMGKQGLHCNIKEIFEPITKAVTDGNQKLHEETSCNTKSFEELDESNVHIKALELMNKNRIIHSSLIRPIAKLLEPTIKSQFRIHDDPDSDNWKDYIMKGEKVTIYETELVFKNSAKIFTLRGDVLKKITDYIFNTKDSTEAKLFMDLVGEMHSSIHSGGKGLRDRNLIKIYFIKRAIFASGLKTSETTNFFSENP